MAKWIPVVLSGSFLLAGHYFVWVKRRGGLRERVIIVVATLGAVAIWLYAFGVLGGNHS